MRGKLMDWTQEVYNIGKTVARMEAKIDDLIASQNRINDVESRVDNLEASRDKGRGMFCILGIISGSVTSIIGYIFGLLKG
jgi:hypothetical protein